jgi:hypothetical protein
LEDVYAGGKLVTWGTGNDEVRQVVGLDLSDSQEPPLAQVTIHGHPAKIYTVESPAGLEDMAMSWQEGGCNYTVLLSVGTTLAEARAYAARY